MTTNQSQSPLVQKAKDFCETLRNDGVVRIDNVLSQEAANSLRDYVLDLEKRSTKAVETGTVAFSERFANVLIHTNRCDLKIPLGPSPVMSAMKELLESPILRTISSALDSGTGTCTLYELSCLISHPGSQRQNVHPDHPFVIAPEDDGRNDPHNNPLALTCFVALQNITPSMGPTLWIPGTHNCPNIHDRFQRIQVEDVLDSSESPKDQLLRQMPFVLGTLSQGSCAIFDSRVLHCGTANSAVLDQRQATRSPGDLGGTLQNQAVRAVFYMTLKHPKVGFPGNEGSIGYGLEHQSLELRQLHHICQIRAHEENTSYPFFHYP